MPTSAERLVWGQGDGSTMPVFSTPLGRVGAAICWESYMPLYRTYLYAGGIELYCAPTVDARQRWTATLRHIALEGRCYVLSAGQFSRRRDYPDDYDTPYGDDPEAVLIAGGSCIIDPLGEVLAGPDRDGETILTATIDPEAIVRARYDFDAVGHYARPDVFRLTVNEREQPTLAPMESSREDAEEEQAT
jgi:nitrilase